MILTARGSGTFCAPRTSLLRTASFRLAAFYLAPLFAALDVALGGFVYWSIRHEILAGFDEAIVEERSALQEIFAKDGRDRLVSVLDARSRAAAVSPQDFAGRTAGGSAVTLRFRPRSCS